jgi:hypothetical protein
MHGGIEVRRLFRNPLTQLLELAIHDDCIASNPDMPIRIGELAARIPSGMRIEAEHST